MLPDVLVDTADASSSLLPDDTVLTVAQVNVDVMADNAEFVCAVDVTSTNPGDIVPTDVLAAVSVRTDETEAAG